MADAPTMSTKSVGEALARRPADENIELPPEPVLTREQIVNRFKGLLGVTAGLPRSEWKAVGDPETLAAALLETVAWMDTALTWKQHAEELPNMPQERNEHGALVTAAGTRSVFDVCILAHHSGFTPSEIKTAWDHAYRSAIASEFIAPGYKGTR